MPENQEIKAERFQETGSSFKIPKTVWKILKTLGGVFTFVKKSSISEKHENTPCNKEPLLRVVSPSIFIGFH